MTQPFDFADLVEEASARAGGEATTGADVENIQRSLYLIQQDWMQKGFPTWRVETTEIVFTGGHPDVQLPEWVDDIIVATSSKDHGSSEQTMKRVPVDQYAQLTNKTTAGRPSQFFLRRSEPPVMQIYPAGTPGEMGYLTLTYIRRPEEFERHSPDSDVPARWSRALVAGLALELARKRPLPTGGYDEGLINRLKGEYNEAEVLAKGDDRERATLRLRMGRRR